MLVLVFIFFIFAFSKKENVNQTVNIILSPHYDDAVLSLGGFITKNKASEPIIVATFFTGAPTVATSTAWDIASGFKDSTEAVKARIAENARALNGKNITLVDYGYLDNQYRNQSDDSDLLAQNISKDIQALIASQAGNVNVYGPADFGSGITHPDHKLLHDAYVDSIASFPKTNVSFYFYEDFPYIEKFNASSTHSIQNYLEQETGFLLEPTPVLLSDGQLAEKESRIGAYDSQIKALDKSEDASVLARAHDFFKNRCGNQESIQACEMTYKVFIAP